MGRLRWCETGSLGPTSSTRCEGPACSRGLCSVLGRPGVTAPQGRPGCVSANDAAVSGPAGRGDRRGAGGGTTGSCPSGLPLSPDEAREWWTPMCPGQEGLRQATQPDVDVIGVPVQVTIRPRGLRWRGRRAGRPTSEVWAAAQLPPRGVACRKEGLRVFSPSTRTSALPASPELGSLELRLSPPSPIRDAQLHGSHSTASCPADRNSPMSHHLGQVLLESLLIDPVGSHCIYSGHDSTSCGFEVEVRAVRMQVLTKHLAPGGRSTQQKDLCTGPRPGRAPQATGRSAHRDQLAGSLARLAEPTRQQNHGGSRRKDHGSRV